MSDSDEFTLSPAGKGWLRYLGLAVDEPRAVGANGLTDAQRMIRAMDVLGNRQFLDRIFNSATKGNFESMTNPPSLPVVSLDQQPSAIWRPTLENVIEWREFSTFIHNKVAARIKNQSSPARVKEIINEAIRNEIKWPTTPAGRKIHEAMKAQTGINPQNLFKPVTRFRAPWRSPLGRQALFNAAAHLAVFAIAAMESLSATQARAAADAALQASVDELNVYASGHRDEGTLIVQVFERRQMNPEAAVTTTFRYMSVSHGRTFHHALWKYQDQQSISASTDEFSTVHEEYIWEPSLNERGPLTLPAPN